jgi:hypothetical protein
MFLPHENLSPRRRKEKAGQSRSQKLEGRSQKRKDKGEGTKDKGISAIHLLAHPDEALAGAERSSALQR